jgi:uncharacterized OB-fold protein
MQIINKVRKCPACGCIAFPDSTRCPKCDLPYTVSNVSDAKIDEGCIILAIIDSRYLPAVLCK